ncbi:MAG: GHKL domain-containing protein, partial [Acetatifactor sp.]|nr:GHKL domain-containing protein [Acetatifactor sp.]
VKSLLYTKAVAILNHDISFELEIAEKVPLLPIDSLTLCRILGILLDNALEASLDSAEKLLRITIVTTDTAVLFSITNSTRPLPVPVSSLLERGYSSKEGHEGIGLATAAALLDRIPQADLSIKYEQGDTIFYQILEIQQNDSIKF